MRTFSEYARLAAGSSRFIISIFEIDTLKFHNLGPLSLTVSPTECLGISGPSGSGKTLLLRALADLDLHQGTMLLDGVACEAMPAPQWRRNVGLLPSESQWWGDFVGDHFFEVQEERLEQLGFDRSVLKWEVARLSTGERQRLAFARLLANQPAVLLLDEATANLDEASTAILERMVDAYAEEHEAPVLWVIHNPEQLDRVASRRLVIQDGRLEEVECE